MLPFFGIQKIFIMIIISILYILISNAVILRRDLSILFNRITIIALIYCIIEDIISLSFLNKGLGLHGGLLHITNITQIFQIFIFFISILILQITSFYPGIIIWPKYLIFKGASSLKKSCYEDISFIVNIFNKDGDGPCFNKIDSILSLLILKLIKSTKNINCLIPFSFSFLFLLLYMTQAFDLIYLNLSLLFFSIGFIIKLVHFIEKWIYFYEFKNNYPLSHKIIKYLLFGILLFNIILIIILGHKILISFKGNIMNKLKDWKLNIDYEIRKGNKSPKKPEIFNFFSSKKKKNRKITETAFNLKERILEIQNNKETMADFSHNSENISLSKTRNWTNRIEIPKVSDFTVESQKQNIDYEYKAYLNQEKKFKKIVLDINSNKENFYPNESKSLFNEYVKVIKVLKTNLKDIKKELKKVSK